MAAEKGGHLSPKRKIELYSGSYFAACSLGGVIGTNSSPPIHIPTDTTPPQHAAPRTPWSPPSTS